jgi:D-sedoheptulose 7-phosphate isomerase
METWEKQEYFSKIFANLEKVDSVQVFAFRKVILDSIRLQNSIFTVGNGGSSAISSHFVTDLNKVLIDKSIKIPIIALGQNSSLSSAIANDYGYDFSIVKELNTLAKKDDLLIVISSSGRSKNILNALNWARENDVRSFALTGFKGSKADQLADNFLNLGTAEGEYGPVEDVHSIICHAVTSYLINEDLNSLGIDPI